MIFTASLFNFFLLSEKKGAVSFGMYDISRSLTIPGWIVLAILLLAVLFGAR